MIYHRYSNENDCIGALDYALHSLPDLPQPVLGIGAPGCVVSFNNATDQTVFVLACDQFLLSGIERHGLDLILPLDLPFGLPAINAIVDQCSLQSRVVVCELLDIGFPREEDHERFLTTLSDMGRPVKIYKYNDGE